jgi:cytochrome subunit of sulfide dehydrogenase
MRTWVGWVVVAGSLWAQSATAQGVNDGRLLASGCFQCHGTSGLKGGFGTLAGVGKEDMLNKLNNDMRSKDARSSIMNPHARGYTSYQLSLIADYFSKLPKP